MTAFVILLNTLKLTKTYVLSYFKTINIGQFFCIVLQILGLFVYQGALSIIIWLTGVLEVDVFAIVGVSQLVGHHSQGHDLLSDEGVRSRDVHFHLWVIELVRKAVFYNFREISGNQQANIWWDYFNHKCSQLGFNKHINASLFWIYDLI